MEITDETVTAYHATRKLLDLYDAYRASSRAHAMVLSRLEAGFDQADVTTEKRMRDRIVLEQRKALAIETEGVFTVRREQLRRRLLDLQGLQEYI